MSTQAIRQLGRYELLRRVAAGGMGEIFLARMRGAAGFEKRVIIKTILPHLAEEEEFIEKFLDEGRIVVQLTHGNIVPVFDMGEEHGEFFIAMEYIPGRDLRDLIKHKQVSGEVVDLPIALHIIAEVCKGLGYAHRKMDESGEPLELVHRDVSPSNVLLSSEGETKLIDFGIARATTKISRTVSGRIQGKFSYMSPEQASGKLVDARSDIFSTGVMLYEMLTGIRPFDGVTDLETIDFVRQCQYDPPSTLNPKIPEEVDAIVAKALCKNLDARYQRIDRMKADILGYLYREDCAPSSTQVTAYLTEAFHGEIERNDLRSGTPSMVSRQTGPKRLDDILGAELDRMGLEQADPFTRTDVSLPSTPPTKHTATLVTDSAQATPRIIEAREIVDSHTAQTTKKEPLAPKPEDDDPPAEEPDEAIQDPPEQVEDVPVEEPPVEEVLAEEQASPPNRRALVAIAVVCLLALGAGLMFWASGKNTPGTLKITTQPEGASLVLDGARVHDAITPLRLEVTPGWHDLEVIKPDFKPYKLRLKFKPGQTIHLEDGALKLKPIKAEPVKPEPIAARRMTITTRPVGASLLVDGRDVGVSPQDIEIQPGKTVIVYAKKEGCEDADVTLSHRYARPDYTISMLCRQDRQPDVVTSPDPPPSKPRLIAALVRVTPPDAVITVNGRSYTGAYTGKLASNKKVKISAYKKGYERYQNTILPSKLKGGSLNITLKAVSQKCLNIRLMAIQMADDVLIDGASIGPVKSSKKHIKLSPGKHTIRAINKVAGKDDTRSVVIPEDATSCVNAVLFPL